MFHALLAAALFGVSAPLAKALLGRIDPIVLAGLFYLGSGAGAALFVALCDSIAGRNRSEAGLRRTDLPWIAGAAICGGVAAPILIFIGLRSTAASTASLLLNLEAVATAVIAALLFRESLGARVWTAVAIFTGAAAWLSWSPSTAAGGISAGSLLIVLGCVLWGVDNNLTRVVSGRDPMVLVAWKGSIAGAVSLILAGASGSVWPPVRWMPPALLFGFLCYGLSIALFVLSLREIGAARTSALFGAAPFLGAGASVIFLREPMTLRFLGAFLLMAVGAGLLFAERHSHLHRHEEIAHDHRHRHDDGHHDHAHPPGEVPAGGAHSHRHLHDSRRHAHPHAPDFHHRHDHE